MPAKKKKTMKKTAPAKKGKIKKATVYGIERDFIIISGGGLVVLILTAIILFR